MSLLGKKVFVTGASGFIGSRLVEKLIIEQGAEVVALVRQFKNASKLARFQIKMVAGDVTDESAITNAMTGCDFAVHCAVDGSGSREENRRITVEGTRNVCLAAQKAKIKRLVHLSTISVYGQTPPGQIDESTPKNSKNDDYGATKLEAENIVLDFAKSGLPFTVLQPTVVFGAAMTHWTASIAKQLGSGMVVLPNEGDGLCNAVYVDDVIQAIFCALSIGRPIPGPYLISGESPVTWAEYYRAFAKWIPGSTITGEPAAAIENRLAKQKFIASIAPTICPQKVRLKISWVLQNLPGVWSAYNAARGRRMKPVEAAIPSGAFKIIKPDPNCRVYPFQENISFMALKSSVSIRKAQNELGFQPNYNLPKAMEVVGPWLQWAGLAPR